MPQPGRLSAAKLANMYPHVHMHSYSCTSYAHIQHAQSIHVPSYTHIFIHEYLDVGICIFVYMLAHPFHMYVCVHTCRHVQASMLSVYLLVFIYIHMCTHSLLPSFCRVTISTPCRPHSCGQLPTAHSMCHPWDIQTGLYQGLR